jgi:hypothetical protein
MLRSSINTSQVNEQLHDLSSLVLYVREMSKVHAQQAALVNQLCEMFTAQQQSIQQLQALVTKP